MQCSTQPRFMSADFLTYMGNFFLYHADQRAQLAVLFRLLYPLISIFLDVKKEPNAKAN